MALRRCAGAAKRRNSSGRGRFLNAGRALVALGLSACVWAGPGRAATLYRHDFGTDTISGKPYTVAPGTLDANLSNPRWDTSASGFIDYTGSAGKALALANSAGTPTYTLTFTVADGYRFALSGFSFWRQRSAAGAQNWSMTVNGADVGSGTVPTTGTGTGSLTPSASIANLAGTITVVLALSGASGTGTFRLDDFTLEGTVDPEVPGNAPAITEGDTIAVTMSENGAPTPFGLTLHATDADPGDTLTWSRRSAPFYGTVTVSGTGASTSVAYVPPAYFNGKDQFGVSVTDLFGNRDTIVVSVTVTPVNTAGKTVYIFE